MLVNYVFNYCFYIIVIIGLIHKGHEQGDLFNRAAIQNELEWTPWA